MFSGTDNILHNISHIQHEWWNIPLNVISMDLNNIMYLDWFDPNQP